MQGVEGRMRALVVDSCALALEADTHLLVSVDPSVQIDAAAEREHVLSRMLSPADIDLVLCVIRKDDFPDHALIETLSHWALGIPVAVLSIHDTIEEMLKVRRSGAAGFIPLSLRRGVIINAIRVLLAGGTYFPACRYLRRLNDGSSNIAHGTARSTLTSLTPRQSEILDFMSHGLTNKEIARQMGLSDGTIRAHVAGIFRTMGVRNRLQATKMYFEKSKARAQIPSSAP